jgi:uncharacterized protein (DUF1697 family)
MMPTFVAMLRGINVGKGKTVKMERLRASFGALGFGGIKTYVQSGNVIFESDRQSPAQLSRKIQERIQRDFGFAVPVLVKTSKEMEQIVRNNPLVKEKGIDDSKLHVTFLSDAPSKMAVEGLQPLATARERFRILNREIYLYCPDGYGKTKLSNTAIEKKLSVVATTRNWRTVNALLEMARLKQVRSEELSLNR